MRTRKMTGVGFALAVGVSGIAGGAALAADQVRERTQDGTCVEDCEPMQEKAEDAVQDQVKEQAQDGSCVDPTVTVPLQVGSAVKTQAQVKAEGPEEGAARVQAGVPVQTRAEVRAGTTVQERVEAGSPVQEQAGEQQAQERAGK